MEVDYLIQNFPGSQDYRGEKATLDNFKTYASRFSILHLGTHGCFVAEGCPELDMQPNTLLFANKQQYSIAEAALLGLKDTEIIVIGACQTAQITEIEGVGLSGLAYIWERAGAKSLIASLWNAPDKIEFEDQPDVLISSEIMTRFYDNLKQGMSKAEAMRQAKLSLIDQHPFFWSPFILIGDAQ